MPGPNAYGDSNWDPMGSMEAPTPFYMKRIKRETAEACTNPPPGILTAVDDQDITMFHAIIIGPEDTPYEGGFFYFISRFPANYPFDPPKVKLMTTGGSMVRFNPNLYASGKVCLSILGTWEGPSWSAACTISSLLISIQSLLNQSPYQNEPGCERRKTPAGFNQMLMHETMRVAVVGMLDNDFRISMPQSLRDAMEREFVKRFPFYDRLVSSNCKLSGKTMRDPLAYTKVGGTYDFATILTRLKNIWTRLNNNVQPAVPATTSAPAPALGPAPAPAASAVIIDLTDCDEPPSKRAK